MTIEMGILLQVRVTMGWQHFTMGINVDSFSFGLLQKLLQILKIMSRHKDCLSFFGAQTNY